MVDKSAENEHNIVVITNGNHFARVILKRLLTERNRDISGIVIVTGDYRGRTGLRSLIELSKVTSINYIIYKVIVYVLNIFSNKLFSQKNQGNKHWGNLLKIPTIYSKSIKSHEISDWISQKSPDLIVSVSCPQRIGEEILRLAKFVGINIHSSLLPAYAGLAPYFWVLSQNEKETGITVHYMTNKFDQGDILVQERITIQKGESAFHLFSRLAAIGCDALYEGVELALQGFSGHIQDQSRYTYFSNPTQQAYIRLRQNGFCLIKPKEMWGLLRNTS